MVELFKYPTVESLVRHLCREEAPGAAAAGDDRRAKVDRGRDRLRQRLLRREQGAQQRERSDGNGQTCNA
jgi:hypothetical protein